MSLPFLKNKKLPSSVRKPGESRYGFSEDEKLSEDAVKELIEAIDSKDHSKLMKSLTALIELIRNKSNDANL